MGHSLPLNTDKNKSHKAALTEHHTQETLHPQILSFRKCMPFLLWSLRQDLGLYPQEKGPLSQEQRTTALEALWPDLTWCYRPSWMERGGSVYRRHPYFFKAVTEVLGAFLIR